MQETETVDALPDDAAFPTLACGTVIDDRYSVVRMLGHGGAAVVYEVVDAVEQRHVALKLLHNLSSSAIKRLRREATIAQELEDPLLVRRYSMQTTAEGTYLTMELVEGRTLRDYRALHTPSIGKVVAIATQLVRAISLLHARGLLHRDIKPSNVLLLADGTIKLADFGLALDTSDPERLTSTNAIVGTIDYLAPEQALGREIDARADLYSLGILLFELLTGELPYPPASSLGTLIAHIQRAAPDVRTRRADVPGWLARLIARLVSPLPAGRYGSAHEVLAALTSQRVARQWRRPAALTVGAVALCMAVAAGIWAVVPKHRFAEVMQDGNGIAGVDGSGRTLWRVPEVNSRNSAIVHAGTRPLSFAYIVDHGTAEDEKRNHELSLLDVSTGTIRKVPLPDLRDQFPSFAPTFHVAGVTSAPIARGGHDFVMVTYVHRLYWPSYTVIVDPITGESGTAFIASGHHLCIGTMDVTHDGHLALIFAGINNRLGWYTSIAAVRPMTSQRPGAALVEYIPAGTPDHHYDATNADALLWYTVVSPHRYARVQIADGHAVVNLADGRRVVVNDHGDPVGSPPVERAPQRRAYTNLADALHLRDGGFSSAALDAARGAVREATAANDAVLLECARRVEAGLLVDTGDVAAATSAFEILVERSVAGADIAYDAARAFHRHNRLAEALRWYRDVRARAVSDTAGRMQYESFEGEILTLQALGRNAEALRVCDQFNRSYPQQTQFGTFMREWLHWRNGDQVTVPQADDYMPDELRYWALELRLASGESPGLLLPFVEREERQASDTHVVLESLRADLLFRLHSPQAPVVIDRAVRDARASNDPFIMAHLPVILERARRIGA